MLLNFKLLFSGLLFFGMLFKGVYAGFGIKHLPQFQSVKNQDLGTTQSTTKTRINVLYCLDEFQPIQLHVIGETKIEKLNLVSNTNDFDELYFFVYDIQGNELMQGAVDQLETAIVMSHFNAGEYFLRITKNGKEVKLFQIINLES